MNTKLEVIRFNNEDVIATSGVFCLSGNEDHIYVAGAPDGGEYPFIYYGLYQGEFVYVEHVDGSDLTIAKFAPGVTPTTGSYYIKNSSDKYVECGGTHNPSVATKFVGQQ